MSDIKGLREISNDPFGKLLTALSKKFSAFLAKDQAELVENPEDVYSDGQDVESALKYHNFVMSKRFDLTTQYFSPSEPDLDKLRVWVKGNAIGVQLKDHSGFNRTCFLLGDPILVDGAPFDYGITDGDLNTKSIALRLNRPSRQIHDEFITITHDNGTRVSEDLSIGISFFIRFKVFDLEFEGGKERTLFEKTDNDPITDGVEIRFTPGGRLKFHVKNSNVEYNVQTATETIALDTVYEVWCTYKKSDNTQHIYINGVDETLSASDSPDWHETTSVLDGTIFTIGSGTPAGNVYGDFYDFMLFREKVVSSTQVANHYENKWTLADIPFGNVLISNYSATTMTVGGLTRISLARRYKWNVGTVITPSMASFSAASFSVSYTGGTEPALSISFTVTSFTTASFTL